jgi:hypothetical protein
MNPPLDWLCGACKCLARRHAKTPWISLSPKSTKFAERDLAPHYQRHDHDKQRHDHDKTFPERQLRMWRVGEENAGFQMVMATFDYSRAVISREALGREFKPY